MDSLFGRTLERSCPAASSSTIDVLLAADSTISPPFNSVSNDGIATYDIQKGMN
jgi:hypothetical protein